MHDAAYKQLFGRPRMVRDLLEGFAARGWSGNLDFGTLEPLPTSYVSRDLQRLPDRLPAEAIGPLEQLEETYTMLEETVQGWVERGRVEGIEQGIEQGRVEGIERGRVEGIEQGIEQGRHEERALLCRQAARKFGGDTSDRLAAALTGVTDPDRLAQVGDWIIECATAADLIARVVEDGRLDD